ncbi:MAG: polyprenyl synthetase family protein [Cytophagales bacterium]|nr:polyprenyl synthetase family protein [Cytophagales bacterium]
MKGQYSKQLSELTEELNREISLLNFGKEPTELYEPIRYIMGLGGKRLRPLLVALAYKLFKEDYQRILTPALAVEVFHNFTLVHDDIMDNAPLRRGRQTVHEKWDENIAILSGDVMMIKVYDFFLKANTGNLAELLRTFNHCAAEVCEGQQKDVNFESREKVSEEEYLDMIRQKTAVLLGFSLELGALLAEAEEADRKKLYEFGVNIGIGFQLMDDLLDVYADQAKFGKQVGGDIIENKKTFLLINALQKAEGEDLKELRFWLEKKEFDKEEKVAAVRGIYNRLGIRELTEAKMNAFFDKGFIAFDQVKVSDERKAVLKAFANGLLKREK